MTVLESLVLPPDVLIVPVEDLPPELRDQLDHAPGDCSVTRPRSRTASSVVNAETAALLERFRTPSTIVDAVIAHSAAAGVDPRATLEEAFGVLGGFVNDGLLVPVGSDLARPIAATLSPGDRVGGFEVVSAVHVVLDVAVHLARSADGDAVALKVAREGSEERMRSEFAHEAAILASLDARVSPRLLGAGDAGGKPFLATSWCAGADVYEAADEARRLDGRPGRAAVLELAEDVLGAYAQLHAQGVLHGDIHPRNVIVGGDGAVTIIDYGLAGRPSPPGTPAAGGRGGVDFFVEPEVAHARLAGEPAPAVSAAGEQYSVAALVYLLLTGGHTHTFRLEREEMLRQLVDEPPLPFERHGAGDLRAAERVVGRALAKRPGERFASLAELRDAFRGAAADDLAAACTQRAPRREPGPARLLLERVLARYAAPGGELYAGALAAPTASVQNGAAGFAYALLRVAGIRGDEALLGQADLWSQRAVRDSPTAAGFRNDELRIVPETVGERSLYHAAPGVHAVAGLVGAARDDAASQQRALDAFVEAASPQPEQLDVAFGRAGLLIGCALMLEAVVADVTPVAGGPLRRLGDALRDGLLEQLAAQPELARCENGSSLGAAHGWAGVLFALLRWSQAGGAPPATATAERLAELAQLGQPAGRGTLWPDRAGAPAAANSLPASWCNGAAGYVSLWTLAHHFTGDDGYSRLAQTAAWSAYEDAGDLGSICCGLAGRSYALLNIYRHGGGDAWLTRAGVLADRAALCVRREAERCESLYNGELGVALLAAELEDPLNSCMPLYESEG